MPQSLHILNRPALKRAAGECALLEGNQGAWIACCSQRFFPLAKRIASDVQEARPRLTGTRPEGSVTPSTDERVS